MSVLTYSEISSRALDRVAANVSTNAPVDSTTIARFINTAYAKIWNLSGGQTKRVQSASAWTASQTTTAGFLTSSLTDIEEVQEAFASGTSTSEGYESGDKRMDRVELSELHFYRRSNGLPGYDKPQLYAISKTHTTTAADVNKVRLDFWPVVANFYVPIWYVPQFTPIDSATVTTPACNDLESLDIALLTAMDLAPLLNRPELVPVIQSELSENTRVGLERQRRAMTDGKQEYAIARRR